MFVIISNPERSLVLANRVIDIGEYQTDFSLEGVPRVKLFIDRPTEMAELERALLPQRQNKRQSVSVLHGLAGLARLS
jgi:hypothetical protein